MKPLKLPSTAALEDKTLKTLCKAAVWGPHHSIWQSAYDSYRLEKGDPWKVVPAVFATNANDIEAIAAAQRDLYRTRSGSGPLARIRSTKGLTCCPMCGSHHHGTLDHYLPRDSFPEFSILPSNLVPACPYCNSSVKKALYKGARSPERFIHPYFDTIAKDPIWYVEILPPYEAARFKAQVSGTVPQTEQQMVRFHLDHILGSIFLDYVETQWSLLPSLILEMADPEEPISEYIVKNLIDRHLRETVITSSINGWRTAFIRGVIMDQRLITFLVDRVTKARAIVPQKDI